MLRRASPPTNAAYGNRCTKLPRERKNHWFSIRNRSYRAEIRSSSARPAHHATSARGLSLDGIDRKNATSTRRRRMSCHVRQRCCPHKDRVWRGRSNTAFAHCPRNRGHERDRTKRPDDTYRSRYLAYPGNQRRFHRAASYDHERTQSANDTASKRTRRRERLDWQWRVRREKRDRERHWPSSYRPMNRAGGTNGSRKNHLHDTRRSRRRHRIGRRNPSLQVSFPPNRRIRPEPSRSRDPKSKARR